MTKNFYLGKWYIILNFIPLVVILITQVLYNYHIMSKSTTLLIRELLLLIFGFLFVHMIWTILKKKK